MKKETSIGNLLCKKLPNVQSAIFNSLHNELYITLGDCSYIKSERFTIDLERGSVIIDSGDTIDIEWVQENIMNTQLISNVRAITMEDFVSNSPFHFDMLVILCGEDYPEEISSKAKIEVVGRLINRLGLIDTLTDMLMASNPITNVNYPKNGNILRIFKQYSDTNPFCTKSASGDISIYDGSLHLDKVKALFDILESLRIVTSEFNEYDIAVFIDRYSNFSLNSGPRAPLLERSNLLEGYSRFHKIDDSLIKLIELNKDLHMVKLVLGDAYHYILMGKHSTTGELQTIYSEGNSELLKGEIAKEHDIRVKDIYVEIPRTNSDFTKFFPNTIWESENGKTYIRVGSSVRKHKIKVDGALGKLKMVTLNKVYLR